MNYLRKIYHQINLIVLISIGISGLLLRIYFYLINRSLWFDEALLGLNIIQRDFLGFFKPLDFNQSAPIGFLLLEKLLIIISSPRDYILRIIPLIAGILSVAFIVFVAKQYSSGLGLLIIVGLFSFSWNLIYYSSELKQYSSDVFLSLVLLYIFKNYTQNKSNKNLIKIGIVGTICIWFSHPSIFILASIGIAIFINSLYTKNIQKQIWWLIAIGGLWCINLLIIYNVSLKYSASNNQLITYWKDFFAPIPSYNNLNWYYRNLSNILSDSANLPATFITVGLIILGILYILINRKYMEFIVLFLPFLITLIASSLRLYPVYGRLLLYYSPFIYIYLGNGFELIRLSFNKINKYIGIFVSLLLVAYFFANPIKTDYKNTLYPPKGEHIKPLLSYLQNHIRQNDRIYAYCGAYPATEFYAPFYRIDSTRIYKGIWSRQDPEKYLDDVALLKGYSRVWIIFSHIYDSEDKIILDYLQKIGVEKRSFSAYGTSLYLFDLSNGE